MRGGRWLVAAGIAALAAGQAMAGDVVMRRPLASSASGTSTPVAPTPTPTGTTPTPSPGTPTPTPAPSDPASAYGYECVGQVKTCYAASTSSGVPVLTQAADSQCLTAQQGSVAAIATAAGLTPAGPDFATASCTTTQPSGGPLVAYGFDVDCSEAANQNYTSTCYKVTRDEMGDVLKQEQPDSLDGPCYQPVPGQAGTYTVLDQTPEQIALVQSQGLTPSSQQYDSSCQTTDPVYLWELDCSNVKFTCDYAYTAQPGDTDEFGNDITGQVETFQVDDASCSQHQSDMVSYYKANAYVLGLDPEDVYTDYEKQSTTAAQACSARDHVVISGSSQWMPMVESGSYRDHSYRLPTEGDPTVSCAMDAYRVLHGQCVIDGQVVDDTNPQCQNSMQAFLNKRNGDMGSGGLVNPVNGRNNWDGTNWPNVFRANGLLYEHRSYLDDPYVTIMGCGFSSIPVDLYDHNDPDGLPAVTPSGRNTCIARTVQTSNTVATNWDPEMVPAAVIDGQWEFGYGDGINGYIPASDVNGVEGDLQPSYLNPDTCNLQQAQGGFWVNFRLNPSDEDECVCMSYIGGDYEGLAPVNKDACAWDTQHCIGFNMDE